MSNKILAGRYELIEKIGEGGMAIVYKGKDRLLNRYVAVKILRPEYTKDEQFIESFRRESQAAAGLSHPNIVGVYDVGKEGNIHFIVMELVEGEVLSQIIKEKGRLDYKEAINIIRQVASALSLAHSNQIVHRDVKPHNIIITNTGVAKLADFGIAKAVSAATIVGGNNKVMGSVHYFSPEQARGSYVDERSDIYSLGIVLYEMLTGKVPFDGDNPVTIALMHINDPMPSLLSEVSGVPPQLEKIINKATAKYQSSRYKNVDEMIKDLNDIEFITNILGKKVFEDENNVDEYKTTTEERRSKHIEEVEEEPVHKERKKGTSTPKKSGTSINKMTIFIIIGVVILAAVGIFGLGSMLGWFGEESKDIEIPSFVGKTFDEAEAEALEKGLQLIKGDEIPDPEQEKGRIISQSPAAGSMVKEGQVVKVTISTGKKDGVVPKLEEMDLEAAIEYAETFGFKVNPTVVESHLPKDTVISQTPAAGGVAKNGTTIEVTVSDGKGKEKVKMPNLIGKTPDEASIILAEAGLAVGNVGYEETEDTAQNLIFWQEYKEGTELEKNTKVGYLISKGEPPEGSGSGDFDMDLDADPTGGDGDTPADTGTGSDDAAGGDE